MKAPTPTTSLRDYYASHHTHHIADTDTLRIYQRISAYKQKNMVGRYRRMIKYYRYVGISSIVLFGCIGWFGVQFLLIDTTNTGTQIVGTQGVQADSIGTIISAAGGFQIINDGRVMITRDIREGDIIKLDAGGAIKVRIDNHIDAKILGPAVVQIIANETTGGVTNYRLKLLDGEFVALQSTSTEINDATSSIQVQMADGTVVSQTSTQKPINVIVKKNHTGGKNNNIVLNQSTQQLVVTDPVSQQDTTIQAATSTPVTISAETELTLAVLQEIDTALSQSGIDFSHTGSDVTTLLATDTPVKGSGTDGNTGTKTTAAKSTKPIAVRIKEQRDYAPVSDMLYKSFVTQDVQNLVTYYMLGDQNAYKQSLINLGSRLQKVSFLIGEPYLLEGSWSLNKIQNIITHIATNTKDDTVPVNVRHNLAAISSRIGIMQSHSYGKLKETINSTSEGMYADILYVLDVQVDQSLMFQ